MNDDYKNKSIINALSKSPNSLLEEGWGSFTDLFSPSGLGLSEDDANVYVDAHLPGLKENDIKIKLDGNTVWVKGEKQQEHSDKRYYQKATSSFSYKITLPKGVDTSQDPEAEFENGELKIIFKKIPQDKKTKEITIKKKS